MNGGNSFRWLKQESFENQVKYALCVIVFVVGFSTCLYYGMEYYTGGALCFTQEDIFICTLCIICFILAYILLGFLLQEVHCLKNAQMRTQDIIYKTHDTLVVVGQNVTDLQDQYLAMHEDVVEIEDNIILGLRSNEKLISETLAYVRGDNSDEEEFAFQSNKKIHGKELSKK